MNIFAIDYAAFALALAHVALGVVVLIFAKLIQQLFSPYSTDRELTAQDNPAVGLAVMGYYAATVIIYVGSAASQLLPMDAGARGAFAAMATDVGWSLVGVVALNGSRWLMDRVLVAGAPKSREVIANRNMAVGALECCVYIASGLVLGGAIRQPGGSVWTAAALFLLGQFALIVIGRAYQAWAGYGVARQIQSGNLAAGVAFGMTLIAIALLMVKAASGEFLGWTSNLSFFAFDAVAGLILLMILRWVTDLALLPNARIAEEIERDQNVNAALIEGVLAIGIAAIILFVF
jgi:uncharacterized membrane protein YjfL (UPF0719 family)